DYNPNVMSPTEKRLLETSLVKDGYTQPVVVLPIQQSKNKPSQWQVVDGYHRYLLSKKNSLNKRINGYLPITILDVESHTMADQMAATIRHNRARGQHQVAAMSDIVRDLSRLGWNDQKIGDELGMSQDEVLRLKQISGLAELFSEHDFSEAWTVK
ncbi:ParB N-terminal domain-containing protein, partial [Proteus mirabilis]